MRNTHSETDLAASAPYPDIERIVSPMIGFPSILTPGSILNIDFRAEQGLSVDSSGWDLQIRKGTRRIRVNSEDVTDEGTEYYRTVQLTVVEVSNYNFEYRLSTHIPTDSESDLYDLRVAVNDKVFVQENAVQVIQAFPSQPKFCIAADPHLGFDGYPCINVPNIDEIPIFAKAIEEVNRIHPDFVVMPGDLVDWSCQDNWKDLRNLLKLFQVPLYTLVGNHDYYWDNWWIGYPPMLPAPVRSDPVALRYYLRRINPYLRYSFDYGPIHAVSLDSGEDAERTGVAACGSGLTDDDLQWLENNLKGRERSFVFIHHPATRAGSKDQLKRRYNIGCITKNREQFMKLCSKYKVAAVFSGHEHADEHWAEGGVDYYTTPSATRSREKSGFRLVTLTESGEYQTEVITNHSKPNE